MCISKQKLTSIALLIAYFSLTHANAQVLDKMNVGIGFGIDYGGLGSRVSYIPSKNVGFFGSAGYNFNAVGYNVGAQFRIPTEKRVNYFVSGMYGYNAVLQVSGGAKQTKTTYYGPSLGAGIELKVGQSKHNFLSFELIVPFRPGAMNDAIHDLKELGYTVDRPNPLAFSVGYHVKLK